MAALPVAIADTLRRSIPAPPGSPARRAHDTLLAVFRRAGIPSGAATPFLPDNQQLSFVRADSLVLQLYWFGERGWEPELLPWWRYFCRRAAAP